MTMQSLIGWRPLLVLSALMVTVLGASADAPTPTLEQRVAGLEAYLGNGDPTAALKDEKGNIPEGLTTASVGVAGPGHNAWMMTSAALWPGPATPTEAVVRPSGMLPFSSLRAAAGSPLPR